ncbi:GntR family transcriptional regulator [Pseudoponticoccus marisrubri]|uniref:GntR family transcriptional regulator n=1 Tax=Pseudoponticoccus marisrubri TaxID=1685382 RepID=A0A0W7WHK6_9RHOB|nr:GntR family transcriptional regulator [Pseudoponticoccus marisrubri]KUF10053.1 GntR family transcriptional regulator [Pseudoponticoccus marisrubri]
MNEARRKPISNAHRAVLQLREMIFSGELAAGSDHLETELADRLGMSRTPVREAALLLESQGLLEMRPRKGVRILPVSAEDMREVYDVLTELESLAAERAAERGLTEQDLAALHAAIDDMERAISADDLEAWAAADDRFHAELVRLGGNSRIRMIVAMMSDQVRRAKASTLFLRPVPVKSNEDHRAVYAAILAGDPATARRIHRNHRRQARDVLTGILEQMRLRTL